MTRGSQILKMEPMFLPLVRFVAWKFKIVKKFIVAETRIFFQWKSFHAGVTTEFQLISSREPNDPSIKVLLILRPVWFTREKLKFYSENRAKKFLLEKWTSASITINFLIISDTRARKRLEDKYINPAS